MSLLLQRRIVRDLILGIILLFSAATLVLYPQDAIAAMNSGLSLCGNMIIPALFPFLVLSSLVVELGMSRYLGRLLEPVMFPLFRVNGTCATALALGFLGGYPVGAQTALRLYQSSQCSRTETERLLAFCNNCGPAFILGVVGGGIFGSSKAGLLLYFVHIFASLLVGFLFRWYKPQNGPIKTVPRYTAIQTVSLPQAFTKSITDALQSLLNICSFILFFSVTLKMLSTTGAINFLSAILIPFLAPAGFDRITIRQLLTGILEMSSGVSSLPHASPAAQLPIIAFILGWAGLSVHCQVMAFLSGSGLSLKTYLTGKFLHGILSAVLMSALLRIVPLDFPAAYYMTEQITPADYLAFQRALSIAAMSAWLVWFLFFLIAGHAIKKSSRNLRGSIL